MHLCSVYNCVFQHSSWCKSRQIFKTCHFALHGEFVDHVGIEYIPAQFYVDGLFLHSHEVTLHCPFFFFFFTVHVLSEQPRLNVTSQGEGLTVIYIYFQQSFRPVFAASNRVFLNLQSLAPWTRIMLQPQSKNQFS